jgi:putative membrane protein
MALSACPMQGGFFGIGWGWIFQVVIFVLFFLVVLWLLKNNAVKQQSSESPLDILKKRLAKGEISKKEFEELRKEIG